jgi:salicylate hydroxylase
MVPRLNIAVCGCGPAGLASALLLKRAGHQVCLLERFETPRPVGSGLVLQPTGLAVLRELGLLRSMRRLGAPIDRLFGRAVPSNRVVLDVRYRALGPGWGGLAVHRSALFAILHGAAVASDVDLRLAVPVAAVDRARDKVAVIASDGRRHEGFDLVVDALGAHSPLAAGLARRTVLPYGALWVNVRCPDAGAVQPTALEQRYRRASQMAGLLPIGRVDDGGPPLAAFFWSLRRDHLHHFRDRGIGPWKADVARLWPEAEGFLTSIVDTDQLTFAQYDHFTLRAPYSHRLVHIGDACRSTSPQLGQGANMALLDALALARALETGPLPSALQEFARLRYWHARLFQWASAAFTPFYQSDSRVLPIVRDWLAAPLSRLPIGRVVVAKLVSGMVTAALAGDFTPEPIGSAAGESVLE